MGVAGVAYATVIAQAISAVCCMKILLNMKETFDLGKEQFRLSKFHVVRMI